MAFCASPSFSRNLTLSSTEEPRVEPQGVAWVMLRKWADRDTTPTSLGGRLSDMKSVDQVLIIIAALIFTGFGVWFLIKPTALAGIGIEATGASARTDIRATYGGFELGVAAFLFWCASRGDWHHIGLVAATLFVAGFGVGRATGIFVEGGATAFMWSLLAVEVVYTAFAVWCLSRFSES